jgi:DNA mismatch repair protein MutS2
MNPKTYEKLELNKILAQLAAYAAFSASYELLEALEPTGDLREAQRRQQETTEARTLLEEKPNASVGGAKDVRPDVDRAARGVTLNAGQLLAIKATLESGITLKRTIDKAAARFPILAETAYNLYDDNYLITAINRIVNEHGEILDSASSRLAQIRLDLRAARDRLHSRLQTIINSSKNAPYLQEALITTRSGRYVIPIKADARGRIKGIIHDQSSSGATLFIEPTITVEINNQIRELELAEQEEIHRILVEMTEKVGQEADFITWSVEALAVLDMVFAKAKYATARHANPPTLTGFDPERKPGSTIKLYNARHPLLDPRTAVPIDAELDPETFILILTGPNTGGKTVSLKTVGLLTLMAQCGLHLPASEESELTVFEAVYADIGDEQSIEQSLSTFSAHLTHIIQILEEANDKSLVLLDELGSGTDPAEGAAIARAILNDLWRRNITTFVATHYPDLKLYAHHTEGVQNASVEFDVETLAPTYRLIVGLPGRSNALAIATRLGLPEHIIQEGRSYVGEDDLQADDLLDEIHRARESIRQIEERLKAAEADTTKLQQQLRDRLEDIEEERREIIEQAQAQALAELDDMRAEIRDLRQRARTSALEETAVLPSVDELETIEAEVEAIGESIETPVEPALTPAPALPAEPVPQRELRPGDHVYVRNLNTEGEIVAIDSGDNIEVQLGNMRLRVDADNLEWLPQPKEQPVEKKGVVAPKVESPGLEIHLRGFVVEEALAALDNYLDQAYLAELPWVRIVHGKGTGALRKAIQDSLQHHPLIKEYKRAPDNQGGDGVTIAYLAPLG